MKIELELGTNELGHDLVEQFFIWKLRGTIDDMKHTACNHHPDDVKQNKKIAKACKTLLEYYGASNNN